MAFCMSTWRLAKAKVLFDPRPGGKKASERETAMKGVPPIVPGTVARIYKNEAISMPYLQVIFAKIMDKDSNGQPRWKVALSDTVHFIQAIALSPVTPMFDSKAIEAGHIIKVSKYSMTKLRGHFVMLLGDIDLSASIKTMEGKLGEPGNVELAFGPADAPPVPMQSTSLPPPPVPQFQAQYSAPQQPQHQQPQQQFAPPPQSQYAPPQQQHAPLPQTRYSHPAPQQQFAPPQNGNYSSYDGRPAGMAGYMPPQPTPVQSYAAPAQSSFIPPGQGSNGFNNPQANWASNNYGGQGQGGNSNQTRGMTGDDAEQSYTPICGVSPYGNTFMIKARCSHKSEIRNWAKATSSGKLFNVTLIDSTGEIRATGFNDVVDKFYDVFQTGQMYEISNASVKLANKRFSNVKNDYEMMLDGNTHVRLLDDAGAGIPADRFSFVPIASLYDKPKDEVIDVIGVAHDVGELGNITVKSTGKQLNKRDVVLMDKTGSAVKVTLWGKEAEEFADYKNRAVVAIKALRVSDFNGRSLSTLNTSVISVNPDITEAHELRGWYDNVGYSQKPNMMSVAGGAGAAAGASSGRDERKTIAQMKDENLGQFEKPDFANIIATISYFRTEGTFYYTACPAENCSKKVVNEGPSMWRCERCQKQYDRCEYRYIMSAQVSDETGQTWLNFFNESAAAVIGVSAEELDNLKREDEEAFKKVIERALLQTYLFKLRIKQEMYQGEAKIRYTVTAAIPVNHVEESNRLISKIDTVL